MVYSKDCYKYRLGIDGTFEVLLVQDKVERVVISGIVDVNDAKQVSEDLNRE